MNKDAEIEAALEVYAAHKHEFEIFANGIVDTFRLDPALNTPPLPVIHSYKRRTKDLGRLRNKLNRMWDKGERVTKATLFEKVTDLSGVRLLHLYSEQFAEIHKAVMARVDAGDWVLGKTPKAYSWDPDARGGYENLGLAVHIKESNYTSIHYLIRPPNKGNPVCCELQVRTLFEEVWGEIDHAINYPEQTNNLACAEQLRVLARLVSTGTRLADSIFVCKSHGEDA
jgi:ppGpp synthetase/RelA/SpoT-type nucleotidyltranferase